MRISEIFYSLQGEGALVGTPSVFVRTAGCNLRCEWCDTKYAWEHEAGTEMSLERIMDEIGRYPAAHAVLTGGEPMIAAGIGDLAEALAARNLHITIETNLTRPPRGIKCHLASLSPKIGAPQSRLPDEQLAIAEEWLVSYDCQFKFVLAEEGQLAAIEDFLARLPVSVSTERIFLMPQAEDERALRERSGMVAELCKRRGYRFGPRLHLSLFGSGPMV